MNSDDLVEATVGDKRVRASSASSVCDIRKSSRYHRYPSASVVICFGYVVVYLVCTTKYGSMQRHVPNWEGGGMLSGSIGVLTVACPQVRSRAPPGTPS